MDPDSQSPQLVQTHHLPTAVWGLLALAALTAAVRLPGITRPLLGNFATKNVVYGMIARNWAGGTANLWYPTLAVMAGGGRSWHMVEFPVSAYLTAWLWNSLDGSLDVWGRATAVACALRELTAEDEPGGGGRVADSSIARCSRRQVRRISSARQVDATTYGCV